MLFVLVLTICSVAKRENQPGQIGSSGGSNPCHPRRKRRMKMMIRHLLLQIMCRMNIQSWSPRTHTPVTWAMESVTTNLLLQTSLWRCGLKPRSRILIGQSLTYTSNLTYILMSTLFPLVNTAAEETLQHTTGARSSCGWMERRPERPSDLYRSGGLHVFYVGLDWPV